MTLNNAKDLSTYHPLFNCNTLTSALLQFSQSDANFKYEENGLFCEFTCYRIPNHIPAWVHIEDNYWSVDWEKQNSQSLSEQTALEGPQYYCLLYWNHPRFQSFLWSHELDNSNGYDFLPELLWLLGFGNISEIEWHSIIDFYSILKFVIFPLTFLT